MRHTTLFLLVASLLTPPAPARADGPAPPNAGAAYARPLHKLTDVEARRLDRKRGLWHVRLQLVWRGRKPGTVCDCETPDGVLRTCRLRPVQEDAKRMTIEATLRVYRSPAQVIRGRAFPAVVEYRLDDAVRR